MLKHLVLLFAALGAGAAVAQDAPATPAATPAPAAAETAAANPRVALHTTMGDIVVEL